MENLFAKPIFTDTRLLLIVPVIILALALLGCVSQYQGNYEYRLQFEGYTVTSDCQANVALGQDTWEGIMAMSTNNTRVNGTIELPIPFLEDPIPFNGSIVNNKDLRATVIYSNDIVRCEGQFNLIGTETNNDQIIDSFTTNNALKNQITVYFGDQCLMTFIITEDGLTGHRLQIQRDSFPD